jgi:hypothetical protein
VKGNALADSTALSVTLPQAIVEDIVKAEIVRHLGKCDELVGSIIGSVGCRQGRASAIVIRGSLVNPPENI